MREIKFRLWVLEAKEMFYPTHGDLGAGGYDGQGESVLEWSPLVMELPVGTNPNLEYLMQFTGLEDKNGKEIYEGHILQVRSYLVQVVWFDIGRVHLVSNRTVIHFKMRYSSLRPRKRDSRFRDSFLLTMRCMVHHIR